MELYGKNGLRLASETKAVFIIKKINCCFLFLLVFSVCAQKEKLPVVSKTKELKTVKGKKIIWKKDGAKIALVHSYKPAEYKQEKTFNRFCAGLQYVFSQKILSYLVVGKSATKN